jgi:hypothetical protein
MTSMNSITDLSESLVGKESNGMNPPDKKESEGLLAPNVKKGQVVQKNYILNDAAALKKKIKQEGRKEAFNMGVEARDGSNMVLELKTSFFEHVKSYFIQELAAIYGFESAENGVAAKATTENSGGAYVE